MKKLKRIVVFIEDDEGFFRVFSTTPKNEYPDYCFHKRHLQRQLGEIDK